MLALGFFVHLLPEPAASLLQVVLLVKLKAKVNDLLEAPLQAG